MLTIYLSRDLEDLTSQDRASLLEELEAKYHHRIELDNNHHAPEVVKTSGNTNTKRRMTKQQAKQKEMRKHNIGFEILPVHFKLGTL